MLLRASFIRFFLFFFLSGWSYAVHAQLELVPLPTTTQQHTQLPIISPLGQDSTGKLLSLPFFEDFSDYGMRYLPDTLRWASSTGIVVNNTLAVTPPSVGVASFDGSDANGIPYSSADPNLAGEADLLVSQFFNLASYDTGQVYLSFYWQAEGRGEVPDAADSLVLQMRTRNGGWFNAWSVGGGSPTQPFAKTTIVIRDTTYLHENFQFRFLNKGKLSGAFDTWHVDYIHFYDSLADNPNLRFDVALSEQPNSFLRNYHDMPLEQFMANPQAALTDTIAAAIQHLADTFNVISHRFQLLNLADNSVIEEWQTGSIGQSTSFSGTNIIRNLETMRLVALPQLGALENLSADSLVLGMRFLVNSNEQDRLIPTSRNDTLLHRVTLHNYFAYDDGTAEYGIGIQERFGELAYRFTINTPDTLTAIDFGFIQLGAPLTGEALRMKIWQQLDTGEVENIPRYTQSTVVTYPQEKNGFIRVVLEQPLLMEGTFYIGYEQLTDQRVTLGYDLNTVSGENIFVNVGNGWEQNVQFPGSLLLRPVFGTVEAAEDPLSLNEAYFPNLQVYPNPSAGRVTLEGDFERCDIYTMQGQKIQSVQKKTSEKSVTVELLPLPQGVYLLKIQRGNYFTTRKLLKY